MKLTLPIAFSTSMLAWGILEFPSGYKKSNQTLHAMDTLRWGTDYLMKTFAKDTKHSQGKIVHYNIVYQVRVQIPSRVHCSLPYVFLRDSFFLLFAGLLQGLRKRPAETALCDGHSGQHSMFVMFVSRSACCF